MVREIVPCMLSYDKREIFSEFFFILNVLTNIFCAALIDQVNASHVMIYLKAYLQFILVPV